LIVSQIHATLIDNFIFHDAHFMSPLKIIKILSIFRVFNKTHKNIINEFYLFGGLKLTPHL